MRKTLVRTLAVIAAPFLLLAGGVVAAQPVSAAASYRIDMNAACQKMYPEQGAFALYVNQYDPYNWFCARISGVGLPPSINFENLGGVDIDAWCKEAHPGSFAVLMDGISPVDPAAFHWRCWKQ